MKTNKYILVVLLAFLSLSLCGQTLKTSYFVGNSTLRHTLNPAFSPDLGYVSLPILSSLGVGAYSNLGASSLLFPNTETGKVMTFLHPDVSPELFLSKLSPYSYMTVNQTLGLFNLGFKTGKTGFWTLDIGERLDVSANIPYEFFKFLKVGMNSEKSFYSIQNFGINQNAYLQASLGYSQSLDFLLKGLKIGAKIKFLCGVAHAEVNLDKLDISMSEDSWEVNTEASALLMAHGLSFATDEGGVISGLAPIDYKTLRPLGYGFAFDFGVEYKLSLGTPVDGLTASFSVTDLGFISSPVGNTMVAKTETKTSFSGMDLNFGGEESNMNEDLEKIKDDLMKLLQLKPETATEAMSQKLNAKIFAGVEYPFLNNKMSVGILYSGRFSPIVNYNELTFIYNIRPARWFDLSLSYSLLNSHSSIGWLLNFTPRGGVNFFIGSDYTPLKLTPQFIPVNHSFVDLQLGISFPMGGKKLKTEKKI